VGGGPVTQMYDIFRQVFWDENNSNIHVPKMCLSIFFCSEKCYIPPLMLLAMARFSRMGLGATSKEGEDMWPNILRKAGRGHNMSNRPMGHFGGAPCFLGGGVDL